MGNKKAIIGFTELSDQTVDRYFPDSLSSSELLPHILQQETNNSNFTRVSQKFCNILVRDISYNQNSSSRGRSYHVTWYADMLCIASLCVRFKSRTGECLTYSNSGTLSFTSLNWTITPESNQKYLTCKR